MSLFMKNERNTTFVHFSERLKRAMANHTSRKSRKEICAQIGVSPATLSSWENGRAFPPANHLVTLAQELELSLDYLLTGKDLRQTANPDFVPWMTFLDRKMHDHASLSAERVTAMERIGRRLALQVDEAAAAIMREYYGSERTSALAGSGILQDDETIRLEGYSMETFLLVLHLDYDHELMTDSFARGSRNRVGITSPGRFLPVIADNLRAGRSYQFILPDQMRDWAPIATEYRRLLRAMQVPADLVHEQCRFAVTRLPIASGAILYRLDRSALSAHPTDQLLFQQTERSIDPDGWFGYTPPPSNHLRGDVVMDLEHLRQARRAIEIIMDNQEQTRLLR